MKKTNKYFLSLLMMSMFIGGACQSKQVGKTKSKLSNSADVEVKQVEESTGINNPPTLKPGPWELKRVSKDVTRTERKLSDK